MPDAPPPDIPEQPDAPVPPVPPDAPDAPENPELTPEDHRFWSVSELGLGMPSDAPPDESRLRGSGGGDDGGTARCPPRTVAPRRDDDDAALADRGGAVQYRSSVTSLPAGLAPPKPYPSKYTTSSSMTASSVFAAARALARPPAPLSTSSAVMTGAAYRPNAGCVWIGPGE